MAVETSWRGEIGASSESSDGFCARKMIVSPALARNCAASAAFSRTESGAISRDQRRLRQGPKLLVDSQDLDVVGAGRLIRRGGRARQLQHRRRPRQPIGQGGAEEAVARGQGEGGAANAGQGQIVQTDAHAIANGQRADQNGGGDGDPEQGAEMAAGVEPQIGPQ